MNRYLEKIADIPIERFVETENLSQEQLQQLFKIFKQLPADSQEGQPGHVTKFVRVKLRE